MGKGDLPDHLAGTAIFTVLWEVYPAFAIFRHLPQERGKSIYRNDTAAIDVVRKERQDLRQFDKGSIVSRAIWPIHHGWPNYDDL